MPEPKEDRFWVDRLCHKHECFGYDDTWSVKVTHDDNPYTLILPKYLPKIDIKSVSITGDLLYAVGRWREEWYDKDHLGAVVVAKRVDEHTFATVVWHETYPWALEKLGLIPVRKRKRPKPPKPAKPKK